MPATLSELPDPTVRFLRNLATLLQEFADEREGLIKSPGDFPRNGASDAAAPKARGPRQQQIVDLPGMSTDQGMRNGEIAKAIHYDEPNVWNTLKVLESRGIVEEMHSQTPGPQRWRLTARQHA